MKKANELDRNEFINEKPRDKNNIQPLVLVITPHDSNRQGNCCAPTEQYINPDEYIFKSGRMQHS